MPEDRPLLAVDDRRRRGRGGARPRCGRPDRLPLARAGPSARRRVRGRRRAPASARSPIDAYHLGEHRWSETFAIDLRLRRQRLLGRLPGLAHGRRRAAPGDPRRASAPRSMPAASGTTRRCSTSPRSFQQWVATPLGVFDGVTETFVSLDPEVSHQTVGGRLFGFEDLPAFLASGAFRTSCSSPTACPRAPGRRSSPPATTRSSPTSRARSSRSRTDDDLGWYRRGMVARRTAAGASGCPAAGRAEPCPHIEGQRGSHPTPLEPTPDRDAELARRSRRSSSSPRSPRPRPRRARLDARRGSASASAATRSCCSRSPSRCRSSPWKAASEGPRPLARPRSRRSSSSPRSCG